VTSSTGVAHRLVHTFFQFLSFHFSILISLPFGVLCKSYHTPIYLSSIFLPVLLGSAER
jgi:hypothetical protein